MEHTQQTRGGGGGGGGGGDLGAGGDQRLPWKTNPPSPLFFALPLAGPSRRLPELSMEGPLWAWSSSRSVSPISTHFYFFPLSPPASGLSQDRPARTRNCLCASIVPPGPPAPLPTPGCQLGPLHAALEAPATNHRSGTVHLPACFYYRAWPPTARQGTAPEHL